MKKLKPGDKAPDFSMIDHKGGEVALSKLIGKKIILFFYPKDLTEGCTKESCNLRDNYTILQKSGFEVIGVSADDSKMHNKFADKHDLPYSLLPDVNKEIINAYGCWGLKKFMGREFDGIIRTTFIIDEKGTIEHIIDKVKTKAHSEQILELYKEQIPT